MPGWRRSALVVGAALLGAATTTLSTALNFGPHACLRLDDRSRRCRRSPSAPAPALLLSLVPRRVAAGFGLIALTALVMLVAQAPADPYFAQSLQGWEQGRFIRFHGAAQWVGWLWPYAALSYLLARLAAREPRREGAWRAALRRPGSGGGRGAGHPASSSAPRPSNCSASR